MDDNKAPGFLPTFIGSFVNFNKYPEFASRPLGSMIWHYLLIITLCCSLYSAATTTWVSMAINPHIDQLVQSVPDISVKDGKATVAIEQPYELKIEGQVVAVIDTTQSAEVYLEQNKPMLIVSSDRFTTLDDRGKIEAFKFSSLHTDFEINSQVVGEWVAVAKSWLLPTIFLFCFLWQVCWKAFQVLIVATVVTLLQTSRPPFTTHLKLSILALGPAMMFGVAVYACGLMGGYLAGTGILFWAIMFGLTYHGSQQLRNGPKYS